MRCSSIRRTLYLYMTLYLDESSRELPVLRSKHVLRVSVHALYISTLKELPS